MSLESLSESNEQLSMSESSSGEKSVRFNEHIQRQLFRSNSSILGQKKKNQKRNQNKRKTRERHNSEGSMSSSSFDGDDRNFCSQEITSDIKEGNPIQADLVPQNKHKKKSYVGTDESDQ